MAEGMKLRIPIQEMIKQVMVQLKYEEIASWLATHRTPLFFTHKDGFTVLDQKYIDKHPKLKKALESTVKDIQAQKKKAEAKVQQGKGISYIG